MAQIRTTGDSRCPFSQTVPSAGPACMTSKCIQNRITSLHPNCSCTGQIPISAESGPSPLNWSPSSCLLSLLPNQQPKSSFSCYTILATVTPLLESHQVSSLTQKETQTSKVPPRPRHYWLSHCPKASSFFLITSPCPSLPASQFSQLDGSMRAFPDLRPLRFSIAKPSKLFTYLFPLEDMSSAPYVLDGMSPSQSFNLPSPLGHPVPLSGCFFLHDAYDHLTQCFEILLKC